MTDKQQAATPNGGMTACPHGVPHRWACETCDLEKDIITCTVCGHKSPMLDGNSYTIESHDCHEVRRNTIASLRAALTERTEQLAEVTKDRTALLLVIGEWVKTVESQNESIKQHEAEVARLKDLVGRCRPMIENSRDGMNILNLLTEIDKEIKP